MAKVIHAYFSRTAFTISFHRRVFSNFARYTNDYENHTKPYIEPIENDIYRDIMISHWARDHEHFASFKCVVTIRCIPPLPNTPTPPHTDWCVMEFGFRFRRNSLEDTIPKLCSDRNGIHTHAREEDVSTATQNSTRLRLDISIFHLVLVSYVWRGIKGALAFEYDIDMVPWSLYGTPDTYENLLKPQPHIAISQWICGSTSDIACFMARRMAGTGGIGAHGETLIRQFILSEK